MIQEGLTYDGTYLWISDRMKDEIYMVDPENRSSHSDYRCTGRVYNRFVF